MGRFENFTPPAIGSELSLTEIEFLEDLTALANSAAGEVLRKESGSIVNSTVGLGTVTSVSVVTANGVSGTVATATTTPAITLTLAAITPTTVFASDVIRSPSIQSTGSMTVAGSSVYYVGSTDVALADGGTGASLSDPAADRIMFWDDSLGAITWLTAGSGLTITATTITATGTGISWSEVTGTSQAAAVNSGYVANNAALVTVTLPDTAAVGDIVRVVGKGAGLWRLAQNASENINFGNLTSTTGVGGYVEATLRYDCLEVICTVANTTWTVMSSIGNLTVV
jgi:hypothetical protein